MASPGKVSEGPHSSTECQSGHPSSLITRVYQYPQPEKLVGWPGIEPRSPAYLADALNFELLTTLVTMNEETLTDDP